MSAFSSTSFKAGIYALSRPEYPRSLYQKIASYAQKSNLQTQKCSIAIDVGCGTGKGSIHLLEVADKVIGIDPGPNMIKAAISEYPEAIAEQKLQFVQGSANDLIEPLKKAGLKSYRSSVSLVTAAQAFHWFDQKSFFKQAHDILTPGGTLAFWGYVDPYFVNHPDISDLFMKFCYGDSHLGPYWEQPGRTILRENYQNVQIPENLFASVERYVNSDFYHIQKTVTIADFLQYIFSFSSYHSWKNKNPTKPDIAESFMSRVKDLKDWTDETELDVEFNTSLVLATRK